MNGDSVCFSKQSDEWETPQDLFNQLNKEFGFTLDAAATKENSKCGPRYCDKIGDSLTMNWDQHAQGGAVWLNPPYSQLSKFIKKAFDEAQRGVVVVCLIPARTDTRWWHDYVMKSKEVRLIKGRLKFGGSKNSAPFPSAIVVFYEGYNEDAPYFSSYKVNT